MEVRMIKTIFCAAAFCIKRIELQKIRQKNLGGFLLKKHQYIKTFLKLEFDENELQTIFADFSYEFYTKITLFTANKEKIRVSDFETYTYEDFYVISFWLSDCENSIECFDIDNIDVSLEIFKSDKKIEYQKTGFGVIFC